MVWAARSGAAGTSVVRGLGAGLEHVGKGRFHDLDLHTLRDFDVGGFYVTYTPSDHNGSKFVDLTVIGKEVVFGFDTERLNTLLRARGYQVNL